LALKGLNPICHLLILLAHHILHVSRIRFNPEEDVTSLLRNDNKLYQTALRKIPVKFNGKKRMKNHILDIAFWATCVYLEMTATGTLKCLEVKTESVGSGFELCFDEVRFEYGLSRLWI
jgi:hypothetical protein